MNLPARPINWDDMGSSEKDLWEERQARAARKAAAPRTPSARTLAAQRVGYIDALADIFACLGTTFGTDEERIARVEEWIANNTRESDRATLQARVAEFLS